MAGFTRYFLNWLGFTHTKPTPPPTPQPLPQEGADPGTRVRGPDGIEGTITRVFAQGGQHLSRVVFSGPRGSWVAIVATDCLEMA
ncbi:MAG: hypothetical protein JRJ84_13570 [Deltaproteobacteria bacterium]|nr:hypothetical protein [Deltaproteobacteria bacterium]